MAPIHVLIIDDSDDDAQLIVINLRRGEIELTYQRVQTAIEVADALAARRPDVVICDYNLPSFSAADALAVLRNSGLDVPFILVSGAVGEETAAAVMRAGAHDFILKDRLTRLVPAVHRELRDAQGRQRRRQAEAALQESEERFRLLAEHVQDVIFRYSLLPQARLEYVSPAVAELTGYRPEEFYADAGLMFSMVDPADRGVFEASWRSVDAPTVIARFRRRDGQLVWVEQRAVVIVNAIGEVAAVEGILRDVTGQILADQERERLDRQLRQTERLDSLGQLAGGVAHDFNNLLAVIMTYAGDVIDALPVGHPCRADVEKIGRAADLTRQLLIFSRLEPSQPQTLDLNVVVTDIEHLLRRTIGEDIEFLTTLQQDLPAVTIDRGKLEQVIINLVMNARAAMPNGGRLSVRTAIIDGVDRASPGSQQGDGRRVCLTVTDTGCGMTTEVAQRAFEPFFTTKGPGQGTGLGLATAYGVVIEAGGEISLSSEPGQGTTLRVVLPAARQGITGTPATQAVARSGAQSGAGQIILLVEDDDAVREVVTRILTRSGYQVIAAATPKDALEICANPLTLIDALMTDIVMPEMSGPQLVERIQAIRPGLPTLLMSGYTAGSLPGGEQAASHLPLIRKPFTPAVLLQYLRNLLPPSTEQDQ
jgi:PAS domain S-box-containing protein